MRLTLAVVATLALAVVLAAANFTGTWKLNADKSKLPVDLASEMMTITQTGPNSYEMGVLSRN